MSNTMLQENPLVHMQHAYICNKQVETKSYQENILYTEQLSKVKNLTFLTPTQFFASSGTVLKYV